MEIRIDDIKYNLKRDEIIIKNDQLYILNPVNLEIIDQ